VWTEYRGFSTCSTWQNKEHSAALEITSLSIDWTKRVIGRSVLLELLRPPRLPATTHFILRISNGAGQARQLFLARICF
jgi:hypothetical protein